MDVKDYLEKGVIITLDDGSGVDVIGLDDAKEAVSLAYWEAVRKWTLWCFNHPTPFEETICKIWGGTLSGFGGRRYCEDNYFTQHLIEKWQSFENRGNARMLFFYCELDTELRKRLVDWVMENYRG